ncbi:MAG TPA: signal peptidase I [Geobacteraceae bacterium]|nr:signal peptidase I [Geobacteraceae bacterium]
MKRAVLSTKQTRWPALILGMTMPGLGQMYNSELLKGLCFFSIYQMLALIGLRLAVHLPDRLLITGVGATLAVVIAFYVWTIREAGLRRIDATEPKSYNRWYFYLAAWLVGMAGINGAMIDHIRTSSIEAFKIVGNSMEPTVLRGDRILADKTAFGRLAPRVGDVVVFVDPDDRSKVFIRKIAALPGQRLPDSGANGATVPHGMVYLLGERSGVGTDSATFGCIPLRDLVGKARQIYWSSGLDGIRWERIGLALGT